MISTKSIILSIREVPDAYIFEKLLNLPEPLVGEEICIKSPLTSERTPSFTLFKHKDRYFYKCFSSGNGGTAIQLAQVLSPDKSKGQLNAEWCGKYKAYLEERPIDEVDRVYQQFDKYKLSGYELRNWSTLDKNYWGKYGVGSKILEHYNIAPLSNYTLSKKVGEETKNIKINQAVMYGFFTKTGEPYKLYQPFSKTCKYFKVKSYVGGADQLKGTSTLIITSGMKDGIVLMTLGIPDAEFICPDSENVMLSKTVMESFRERYKQVVVLFDADNAGIESTKKYEQVFGTKSIYINTFKMDKGKDVADFVLNYSGEKVKQQLIKLL